MKILHVHENLRPAGGIETYLLSLIPRLEALGHSNAVAFGSGDRELVRESYQAPSLSSGGRSACREGRRQLSEIIRRFAPDVIHLHNMYNVGAIDACMHQAPTVLTGHDFRYACPASSMFFRRTEEICQRRCGPGCFATTLAKSCLTPRPKYALQYYHRVRWMAKNWRRLGRLIAPSQAALDRFIQAGMPPSRGMVIPYFCPVEPLMSPRPAPTRPTVLFLGRLSRIKGYQYFIKGLGLLPGEVKGILVGNVTDSNRPEIMRLAVEAGCEDRLEIRPWASRDGISSLMREATVFCFPSICPETLGITGLEALAQGVPVVASDVGGVREWLVPGQTGLLVKPKDPGAMAHAVQQLLDAPGLANDMGCRGLRLVESKFQPETHLSRLLGVYESLAGAKPASSPLINRVH